MAFDPEDVLGAAGVTDPGKGQKPSPGFDPSIVKQAAQGGDYPNAATGGRNLIAGTIDPNTNFNDFRFQPKTNADNYLLRAQDQGFWESLGKTLANTAANIPLDVIQGVGYLGTMLEVGDDRDYSNALTTELEKLKNPTGEVYLEHPDRTIDMGDSAWWLNNLGSLAESAGSFAIEGAGISKIFGTLAKTAAWSTRAAKLGAKAAQGLSAATLTYMEGAMSGAQVYETAYNNNYMKLYQQGMNPNDADMQAKHIASQAAAATVQLHTAMNLALNLTALTPLFREPDQAIISWWKKNGKTLPGETTEQWTQRIAQAVPEGMPLKKLLGMSASGPTKLGLEALQEGIEEVNTQYAEHVGKSIGEGKEKKDVAGRFADIDRYFSEVLNQEGALNMALGALGGVAQTVLLEHIPVHKVVKYGSDGKPLQVEGQENSYQTERVSAHTLNERMNRQYFDNIRESLTKDMEWFSSKNKELDEAMQKKDLATVARIKADLLSVHNLRAISMGLGDVWKQQYQDIASLDNTTSLGDNLDQQIAELDKQIEEDRGSGDTEAMNQKSAQRYELQKQQADLQDTTEAIQKGFAQNKADNSYREKALKASQDLDYLTKLYEDMHDKYSGTPEMDSSDLADHMFYRQANLYLQKQQLDQMEHDLIHLRSRVDDMTLSSSDDLLIKQAKEHLGDREVLDGTVKKLNQDITRVNEAVKNKNTAVLNKILDKYKIPATSDAGKKLVDILSKRKQELENRAIQSSTAFSETIELWKQTNPNSDPADIIQRAAEKPVLEDIYNQNKAYHQQAITEYETAKEQLGKDSTEAGVRRYLKENKPADTKEKQKKDHIEAYNQQLDREIAANMDAKQKTAMVSKLDDEILQAQEIIKTSNQEITGYKNQLKNSPGFKNYLKRQNINKEISGLQEIILQQQMRLMDLQTRRVAMTEQASKATTQKESVSRTPPPVSQPVTTPSPGSTPAENASVEFSEELPDFDFSEEVTPVFTTVKEGDSVFDKIMGSNEAGNTIRQFIQLKKEQSVSTILVGIRTMLQKTNQEMPSQDVFDKFIEPYVTNLRNQYLSQTSTTTQDYEDLKRMLKPGVLNILDNLEEEFRKTGFSYDRALQVLNQQVKEGNLSKHILGVIMTRMKSYLEEKEDPVIEQQENKEVEQVVPQGPLKLTIQQYQGADQTGKDIIGNIPVEDKHLSQIEKALRSVKLEPDYDTNSLKRSIAMNASRSGSATETENGYTLLDENDKSGTNLNNKLYEYAKGIQNGTLNLSLKDFLLGAEVQSSPEVEKTPVPEGPTTYIPPAPDSEPTVFTNASMDLEQVSQQNKVFVGAQNIEAVKANFNTHPYKEFDNGSQVKIIADYTQLDPGLNTDLLIPGKVVSNDNVTFQVDEDWSGQINYDSEMVQDEYGDQLRRSDMFQNYLESPDKIGMSSNAQHPKGAHANVPIKIIHNKTGETIGYLPRADWVLAKYPDTDNYRNVTDQYQDGEYEVTDNVARQYGKVMKLREAIVRAWNTDKTLKLSSKVSKRGTGHVMLNREVNPNTGRTKLVQRSAKNMLPDPSLEIAILKQGTAYVGSGIASQKQITANLPPYMRNATSLPVAMLPSPDGTHVPTPLYTHRLGDNPSQLNTVVGAIVLYLRSSTGQPKATDAKAITKIQESTGFDIRTPEGLRNFTQQYFTYTQKFGEKNTVIMPSEVSGKATSEFMLDIPDLVPGEKTSFIKVGTSFSGEKPIYAQLINGELHPDFEDALRLGLSNRFKNVVFAGKSLRGINSQGEFKAPIIKKDGTVQVNTYNSYNEFVKANSITFAYGLNKVGNQYVYMANPVVQLDYENALKSAPPAVNTSLPESVTPHISEEQELEEPDELADLFGNGILSPSPGSVEPLAIPTEGEKVSLELLQDLRNLTPEAHRNQKTPEQVLRELLERGVTVLADGHNPFYTC
jgi:hypothetical protein